MMLSRRKVMKYVLEEGKKCPVCKSCELEAKTKVEKSGNGFRQEVHCNSCESSWFDLYYRVGVEGCHVRTGEVIGCEGDQ